MQFQGVINIKKEYKAGKREEENDGRDGVGMMLWRGHQGGPLGGGDIWQIWTDEQEPGTKWFSAEGVAWAKVQRLEQAEEYQGGPCGWCRAKGWLKMRQRREAGSEQDQAGPGGGKAVSVLFCACR